jgi:flavin-dependent dehydrogenase
MTLPHYDITVIGGSVAGSLTALLLGKRGFSVALFEPHPFPRRKACGEGLSLLGMRYLQTYGIWNNTLADIAYPFYNYDIYTTNGKRITLSNASHKEPEGFGISRLILDLHLLRTATSLPSVDFFPLRVEEIKKSGDQFTIYSPELALSSRQVVVASGMPGRNLTNTNTTGKKGKRFGFAAWFGGVWSRRPRGVTIFHRPEGCFLITPLGDANVNISLFLHCDAGKKKAHLLTLCKEVASLAGFQCLELLDQHGVPSVDASKAALPACPLYLVGDTQERLDPIGGMGMTHALFTADRAANRIISVLHGLETTNQGVQTYTDEIEHGAKLLRAITSLSHRLNVIRCPLSIVGSQLFPSVATTGLSLIKNLFPSPCATLLSDTEGDSTLPLVKEAPYATSTNNDQFRGHYYA